MENYHELQTTVLIQWYVNARTTASCGGHFKGQMNDERYRDYALELRARGVNVPKSIFERFDKHFEVNVELPEGIFNGPGSF